MAASVKRVLGYGAGLRRQLETTGMTQEHLAQEAGVSRQTIARAINADEVSTRTGERIAAILGHVEIASAGGTPPVRANRADAGQTRKPTRRSQGRRDPRRSIPVTWINATDLEAWADRRDAQETLPLVLRNLVFATLTRPTRVSFRSGEGVQLAGFDGVVVTEQGAAFVPEGTSVWECGVQEKVKQKADDDYAKRTTTPGDVIPSATTFVFVTPRRWGGRDAWATARKAEGKWRDVIAYDADDLEAWLDEARAVHVWLSTRLGSVPEGSLDLGTFWSEWSAATVPALSSDFILAGRDDVVRSLRAWLDGFGPPMTIRAESREEAIAVVAAAIAGLPGDRSEAMFARAVVVANAVAWRRLMASRHPLMLLPTFDAGELVSAAARAGHGVIVPLGEGDVPSDQIVQVLPVLRPAAAAALEKVGMDRERADELAALARRSVIALRRHLAKDTILRQPVWAQPSNGRTVLPALLVGAWNNAMPEDRQVVAAVARAPYDEVSERLMRWARDADPPLRRRGDAWYLVSKSDAWTMLARYLTREDLERFAAAALAVLGAVDPRFDLPVDQRWMAGALGHSASHSRLMRQGIATTLAIMGLRTDRADGASPSPHAITIGVIRELLARANTDWRLWASLSPQLPDLAEAAPDVFLRGVEAGLCGESPVLVQLFTESEDAVFGSSPHTGLLWALERLAWSSELLGRVVPILAQLAVVDPGGKLANRPLASLNGIFRSWFPQSAATLGQRLRVLDVLRKAQPEIAWSVLKSMLPQMHSWATPSAQPQWWDWAPEGRQRVSGAEYTATVREIVRRLMEDAGTNGARWGTLVDALPMLPAVEHAAILDDLALVGLETFSSADRATVWDRLRAMVGNHRSFNTADWAMGKELVDRIDVVRRRFEPADPVAKFGWLFSHTPTLPESPERARDDFEGRWADVEQARKDAVAFVADSFGIDGLTRIAQGADVPELVGSVAAQIPEVVSHEDEIVSRHIGSAEGKLAAFAWSFAAARARSVGPSWGEAKLTVLAASWSVDRQLALLHALPARPETWHLAGGLGAAAEREYWRGITVFAIDTEHAEFVAQRLLDVERPYAAVDLLAIRGSKQPTDRSLLVRGLEAVLGVNPATDRPSGQSAYSITTLLERLRAVVPVDDMQLATLEWHLLPIVDRYDHAPVALHRWLARDASFFVDVVSLVYRGEGEAQADVSVYEQRLAERGYSLLQSWRTVPGLRADGVVDQAALRAWVDAVREALITSGRRVIGDRVIGQVLSGSPADADGAWPCRAVRDVIEAAASDDIEQGFVIGVFNSRGVITRDLAEGGTQERQLADRYDGLAAAVADEWPRTAAMLRGMAQGYREDASREDQDVAIQQDLG